MSPTAPTYLALYKQLGQAHRRIRELEARENNLLTEIRTLCAAVTERTHSAHSRTPGDLNPSPQPPQLHSSPATNRAATHQRCTAQARQPSTSDKLGSPLCSATTTELAPQHPLDYGTF